MNLPPPPEQTVSRSSDLRSCPFVCPECGARPVNSTCHRFPDPTVSYRVLATRSTRLLPPQLYPYVWFQPVLCVTLTMSGEFLSHASDTRPTVTGFRAFSSERSDLLYGAAVAMRTGDNTTALSCMPHPIEFHECSPRHSSTGDARSNPHFHLPIFPRYYDSIDSAFGINARHVNVPSF